MTEPILNRRDLHRLALAALGGLASGVIAGCGPAKDKQANNDASRLLQDQHVCRGLNTCKNKGKDGTTNDCAGQGHCARVAAHDCNGTNACKGQGGCGEHPGENDCKGKGTCEVPLRKTTWPKGRQHFEEQMAAAGKKFAAAPDQ
jgi:hypothetical protein